MKKMTILIITFCLAVLSASCSEICEPIDDIGYNATEEEYIYALKYMGTWYGFGTDGDEAQFEINIREKDADNAYVTIEGWGTNSNLGLEEIEITFDCSDYAKENTESQQQRIFRFSVNEYDKEVLEINFIDRTSGKQIAQSIYAGRDSNISDAFDEREVSNEQPKQNYSAEKNMYQERYNQLSAKTIPEAPQQEMNFVSSDLYSQWDLLLNDVYNFLKSTKSSTEFESIKNDEIAWIKEKEAAIESSRNEFAGGSMAPFAANTTAIEYTKERCYYLISLIN